MPFRLLYYSYLLSKCIYRPTLPLRRPRPPYDMNVTHTRRRRCRQTAVRPARPPALGSSSYCVTPSTSLAVPVLASCRMRAAGGGLSRGGLPRCRRGRVPAHRLPLLPHSRAAASRAPPALGHARILTPITIPPPTPFPAPSPTPRAPYYPYRPHLWNTREGQVRPDALSLPRRRYRRQTARRGRGRPALGSPAEAYCIPSPCPLLINHAESSGVVGGVKLVASRGFGWFGLVVGRPAPGARARPRRGGAVLHFYGYGTDPLNV
ncbi:hypothetical protein EVAR_13090_1 [Eumeta japonica]|uniref:Uncharacterized protein n=1 Tax=Eumeta variegata TaxID=151549 RepID=A0A4C1U9N1_EUMVA|nr:hypothetical protein EVAR_13090_1 [Eumeta japonica]